MFLSSQVIADFHLMHLELRETPPTSFRRAGNGPLNAIDPLQIYIFFARDCPREGISVFIPSMQICYFLEGASQDEIIAEFTSPVKLQDVSEGNVCALCCRLLISNCVPFVCGADLHLSRRGVPGQGHCGLHADVVRHQVAGSGGQALPGCCHRLHGKINPAKSSVIVKPKRVTVVMPKAERKHWTDLYHKEDKVRPTIKNSKDASLCLESREGQRGVQVAEVLAEQLPMPLPMLLFSDFLGCSRTEAAILSVPFTIESDGTERPDSAFDLFCSASLEYCTTLLRVPHLKHPV
jgi:hypothetical protein